MSLWGFFEPHMRLLFSYSTLWLELTSTEFVFIMVWLSASSRFAPNQMAKRIPAFKRIGPHHQDVLSVIYGSLLGDSHAEYRSQGNGTRLQFHQEASHKEYLLWLHDFFLSHGYCTPTIPRIKTRLAENGKLRYILRFSTFTYTSFNDIHSDWYVNGVKRVPANIESYLTPLALAIWIMDDGGRVGSGVKLATNSFTFEDTTRLSLVLNHKFGLKSSVQSAGVKDQYHIYIWAESMPLLRSLVKQHMVPTMFYKLGNMEQ